MFQKYESQILVFNKILEKIEYMKQNYKIAPHILDDLQSKYQLYLSHAMTQMNDFLSTKDCSSAIKQSL